MHNVWHTTIILGDRIILGSGITGIVAGYYLDVPVIGEKFGGQYGYAFPLGPRYIHSSPETRGLLDELDIKYGERKVKVGYFYDNGYHDTVPESLIREYSRKTRGEEIEVSMGKGGFTALTVTYEELIRALKDKILFVEDRIVGIEGNTLIGERGKYGFKTLISTIPLPSLYGLFGISLAVRYRGIGYRFSSPEESFFFAETFGDYDYVYFPELKYPYYRVTRVRGGFVYEFPENPEIKYPNGMIWQKIGKILPPYGIEPPREDIILLGRYGAWDDRILLQDVIRKCLSLR
jgi:hypothetical protein